MENLSLKELKAQNAAGEAESNIVVDGKQDVTNDEYIEVTPEASAVVSDSDQGEDAGKDSETIESWMQTEEAETSADENQGGFVPNHEAASRRKKGKALRVELKEKANENEELKARIAALESGSQQVNQEVKALVKPTREQFDYDDDAYDVAIERYYDDKFDRKLNNHSVNAAQQTEQKAQQQQAVDTQQKAIGDHYERAQKLIDDGKITTESYQNADKNVRLALNSVSNGNGDKVTNILISTLNSLGKDSEKVMYQLGVNPAKLQELQRLLSNDPTGFTATAYVGGLQKEISTPSKRRSQAPSPANKVDGEGGQSGKVGTLQKQYNKLDDIQARISFKRKAKKEGVDTTKW